MRKNRKYIISIGITVIVSLVMLIDFTLPGKVFIEEVIDVEKKRQQYYNAGGNYHYSYKVITSKHHFSVSEGFAKSVQNREIKYSVSLIFNEINRHSLHSPENSTIYSFRIVSGLILPLIVIITIAIAYSYKKKISTLIFVLQIILLANFILLIFC